jgi:uncharacterized protein with PQ loop repeat
MSVLNHPEVLAYVASALGVMMVLPQIQRIVRHPHMGGVSPWTWAITVVACSVWLTYGVRAASMPQIPGNVLLVSGAVAVVLLVPAAWSRPQRAAALAGVTAGVVLLATRLPTEAVGFLAFAISLAGVWPQVYETVWLRRGMGPSALSLTSAAIKLLSQSLWFAFAVLTTDLPVLVASTMMLTTNTTITLVELSRRRAAVDAAPPLERVLVAADA